VTDRAAAASLLDETPVEDLPLPRATVNRLRVAGVLTLGQLRAMPDRELLGLRRFGPHSLADVRALVPAPAGFGSRALPSGGTVAIAGREFVLGAVYAARDPRPLGTRHRPRRLVDHDPGYPWPGGRVEVELVPGAARSRAQRRYLPGRSWAAWAGDRVGP
jgi:RNA polymerase alpha subunit